MLKSTVEESTEYGNAPFQTSVGQSDPFQPQMQMQDGLPPTSQMPQQQFQPSPSMSGTMDNGQMQMQQPPQAPSGPFSWCGNLMTAFSIDTYRAYFDIDADDIVMRMKSALVDFYKPQYFRAEVVGVARTDTLKGPDLYGPFWITMTLIFLLGVTSNMHAYVHADDVDEFDYDINHLLHAASTMCVVAFVIPTVLWVTTQCLSMNSLQLVECVCIYGYSLIAFIPAGFICVIPFSIMSWIALLVATAMSAGLIVRNIVPALMTADTSNSKAPALSVAILVCHGILFFVMKFRFYHQKSK
mmetsp:Transcript_6625/g.17988  ORF Transcript_6625/g.17988 Transcript_6625/m.17988 type:complete len:299 (-) Transcript_6625:520-1416(-)|eukprot:CAMPEP_0198134138 /NCGR_PEP_ID=MMETSP1442-20131203/59926_1 /TAXON_ID= /ORGANISM="Craspedostauros australis, Strain CCMP3328" /LENGTH=298 /DNA_ID=CAMNT_0043795279 /DNA_START=444 /DNA_END=1340 /DNA_ORIENTATION=-